MQAAKALVSLRMYAGSPEPSLLNTMIVPKSQVRGGPNSDINIVLQMVVVVCV